MCVCNTRLQVKGHNAFTWSSFNLSLCSLFFFSSLQLLSTYLRWHHQAERTCKGTCFYTPLIATSATSLAKLLLQASVHASNMLPNERQQHITSSTRLVEPRRSWGCMPDSLSGFPVLYLTQIEECNTFFSTQWPCFLVFELSAILCSICGTGMSDLLLLTELTNALDLLSAITRPLEVATGRFNLSVFLLANNCRRSMLIGDLLLLK